MGEEQKNNYILEKEQCQILFTMIEDYDFENFKSMSLKILEQHPENKLAKMFYKLNVIAESLIHGDFVSIDFSTSPITDYFTNNNGQIDIDLSKQLLILISQKTVIGNEECNCVREIIKNVQNLGLKDDELKDFYLTILILAKEGNVCLKKIEKLNKESRLIGLKSLILTDNEYIAAYAKEYHTDIKNLYKILLSSKSNFEQTIKECCEESELLENNVEESKLSKNEIKEINKPINKSKNSKITTFIIIFIVLFIICLISSLIKK